MSNRLSGLQISFLVSATLHFTGLCLLPESAEDVKIAGTQSQQKVYLVDAPAFRNEFPVRSNARSSNQTPREVEVKKEFNVSQKLVDVKSESASPKKEQARETSPAAGGPAALSESVILPQGSDHGDAPAQRAAFAEWFSQVAIRCNNIQLPRNWLSLRDFWPRRYEVGFVVDRSEGEDRLKLQRMRAIAGEVPALDGRIKDLLTDCLKKYGQNGLATDDWSMLALNRDSGEAYSVTLEFTDGSYSIVSPRGI